MRSGETDVGKRKWPAFVAGLVAAAFVLAGCGADDPVEIIPPQSATPTLGPSPVPAEPVEPPTEFRVAYINLLSPLTLDETNTGPAETFAERLDIVIEELKAFKPDLVAFSEVTWTEDLDDAAVILARELKMEVSKVRTKPWDPGQSRDSNDALVKQFGWEESELILVRGNVFPPAEGDRIWLNPRTSEIEVPGALWLRVKPLGLASEIDVFVTHLTGIDAAARARQAADFAQFIKDKRGDGPLVVLGDFADGADAASVQVVKDLGLADAFEGTAVNTCCREGILGEQPALTLRTDFLLTSGLGPAAVGLFASEPKTLADGQLLYASDHNGITAVFPIPAPQVAGP